jgi:hypothetical protein
MKISCMCTFKIDNATIFFTVFFASLQHQGVFAAKSLDSRCIHHLGIENLGRLPGVFTSVS